MKTCMAWLFSLLMLLVSFNVQAATNEAGLALTFDDDYVDQWYDYFITNDQNFDLSNVKVTFFVSNLHLLSTAQINKLHALETAGHEIASHSYSHGEINIDDPNVNNPSSVSNYLNTQVLPSMNEMVNAGFAPVSFSYPSGAHTPAYDDAIRTYFPYLRAVYADENHPLATLDHLYHNSDKYYTYLEGDSIDSSAQNELPEITDALTRAKNNTEILTLYTHRILPDGQTHTYGLNVSKLNGVINAAKQRGLTFYTFSQAYSVGPAPNPDVETGDPNNINATVESSSRIRVKWSNMPISDFVGIVPVGSQYWLEGATTDGSPTGNIGINVAGVQAGQEYTAVLYYQDKRVVTSAPFIIIPATNNTNKTLTVSKSGTGTGTVTSSPAGISCGTDCTEDYVSGSSVTLTATATAGSTFTGWSGGGCSGTATCTVSMTATQTVTANFTVNTPPPSNATISISIENTNRVRVNWSNMPNHNFIGIVPSTQPEWQSNMSGTNTDGSASGKIGITVSEAIAGQTYSAVFYLNNVRVAASTSFVIIPGSTPSTYTLTVSKSGTGTGTVSSAPTGISCGTDCTEAYSTGTNVTLTAVANSGSTFSGWSGGGCSGTAGCTLSMTAAQTVTANFTASTTPPAQTGTINITVENQKRVRSKWNGFAADFIGIVPVGQSNWQQGMEGANVDSSVTSGNVGVTVNNPPYNQQYVVMFYRNNVKVATSDPFVIRTTP